MVDIVEKRKKEVEEGVDISNRHDLLSKFLLAKDENGDPQFDDKYHNILFITLLLLIITLLLY